MLGFLKRIFRRREKEEPIPELSAIEERPISLEPATLENLKAKMDLILTQLDSVRVQNETLNERIKTLERILLEIRKLATS